MEEAGIVLIVIIIRAVWGAICAAIASSKGRNVVGWFFGGLLLDLIGIIIICCLSNLKEEKNFRERAMREQHRLREQLAQERLKSDAFRTHTYNRLDAHDQVLGVDTRTGSLLDGSPGPALLERQDPAAALEAMAGKPQAQAAASGQDESPTWYYESQGKSNGPITAADIRRLLQHGRITRETLVWNKDLVDWVPLGKVRAFASEVV